MKETYITLPEYFNSPKQMKTYALLLQKGKYYIGKTQNFNARMFKHFNNEGSEFTKLFSPIRIHNTWDGDIEEGRTLAYMIKYGVVNVRGGVYAYSRLAELLRRCPRICAIFNRQAKA